MAPDWKERIQRAEEREYNWNKDYHDDDWKAHRANLERNGWIKALK